MSLSKLPAECLDQIFDETVLVRNFKRAMRLRTVSRRFRDGIITAIYRTRFLERLVNSNTCELGPYNEKRYPEWTSLLYTHLAQRIWHGPDVACPKSRLRLIVERICELRGDTKDEALETCIHNLCPLVFFSSKNSDIVPWIQSMPESELSNGQFNSCLIDATVHLGLIELTSTLLEAQVRPASGTSEFAACVLLHKRLEIAAFRGNLGMIRILLATESTFKTDGYLSSHLSAIIVRGAAQGSHKDICNFALEKREPSNSSGQGDDSRCQATWAMECSENYEREIAAYELSLNPQQGSQDQDDDDLNVELCKSAYRGSVHMVRYFLDRGACLNSPKSKRGVASLDRAGNLIDHAGMQLYAGTPLHAAVNHIRNETIVKMLLEHGVDPNWSLPELNPLKIAVEINWPSVVRMLINYGANINEGNPPPIVVAVEKEDMDMFRFLRQKGAVLNTPETGSTAMALAKYEGLVSMVTVLADAGVEEVSTTTELKINRQTYLTKYTLSYYMTTKMGKTEGIYGEYQGQWSITKALENGNGFKPWPHKRPRQ